MFKKLKPRRLAIALTIILMVVSMFSPGLAVVANAADNPKVFDIIEITDFHGALEDSSSKPVAGVLAQNIKDIKNANPDRTLILSAGDLYQGTPVSNILKGVPVQKVMSSVGVEVTALGNHEFDWGLNTITDTTMKDAKYSIICANLYDKATGKRVFEPYKIIDKDGVKIAVIGAITAETPSIVLPKYVENYEFKDAASEINGLVKEVKDKGANVVLALMHAGDKGDGKTGEIFDIAGKLTGVDAVFGGHSHTILNTTVNGMPLYIANNAGKGFIDSKMTIDNGKVSFAGEYKDIYTDKPNGYKAAAPVVDADVKAIVDAAKAEVGPTFAEVIGSASSDLTRTQIGTPYGESFLGNWSTDVMRAKVNADVAMQNNGGLRIDIPKGDITVGTIFTLMPFDNYIYLLNMNKEQIKTVLEQAFADNGRGVQLSGLKVKYDPSKPSGSRVVSITRENDAAIKDTEILKVATNDFMASGGDGFTGFIAAGGKDPASDTHILVRDALLDNVRAAKGITATMNNRIENVLNTTAVKQASSQTLPKTGSPVDMGILINLGGFMTVLGSVFIAKSKKEEDKAA